MDKFDDIPIKVLNKADGYQQKIDENNVDGDDEGEEQKSLMDRIDHTKWKVRMKAYKEVSELFYHEYTKQCQKAKFDENPLQEDEDTINPFE